MYRKNIIVTLLILFLSNFFAFAQNSNDVAGVSDKARKYYAQAEALLNARKFDQAVAMLQKATEKDPQFAEAYFRLGTVYEVLLDDKQVQANYEKSIQIKPKHRPFMAAYYTLAHFALQKGNYQQAEQFFNEFLNLKPPRATQIAEAQRGIATCRFAVEAMRNPFPFRPQPLPKVVNRFALQYFPVLTADQQTLIFTARDTLPTNNDENLYISHKNAEGWTPPVPLAENINTPDNEGTCTISADGRTLVFTSCKGRESFGSCDLFVTYKIGNEWTMPINLGGKINSIAWESQPSLSADGRTIYFVSDKRGGYGKRDIWRSELAEDGAWGNAVNMGPSINSVDDDLSPFIHANSTTLFFSSKGHPGLGGFDLFYAEKENDKWAVSKNLGYPINTYDDQVSLFVTADGRRGYYSHEEKMGRKYVSSVLHEFEIPQQIAVQHKSDYLKGTVYDAKTKQKLGARIELFNLGSGKLDALMQADRKTGEYLTVLTEGSSYALYVNKDGYLFKSLYFDFADKQEAESLTLDIYLQPTQTGAKDILNNLFFATGEYALEEKSKTELEKLINFMNENKNIKLEISGHTDDVGQDDDNKELSLKRAKNVYDYLLKAGISPTKVTYAGYGETQFYVPNNSEKNRQLNRRIEFKVL